MNPKYQHTRILQTYKEFPKKKRKPLKDRVAFFNTWASLVFNFSYNFDSQT